MFNKSAMNMNTQQGGTSNVKQTTTSKNLDVPIPDNSVMGRLNKIKEQGNDLFRQNKFGEANDKYYEVLNEISYVDEDSVEKYRRELDDLELLCRLNIANVKLKIEDYDLALRECLKVLKKNEKNFKGNYRAGICYYKKGNYNKAFDCFTKAKEINSSEEAQQGKTLIILVDKYIRECKRNMEPEAKVIIPQEEHKIQNVKIEEERKVNNEPRKDSKREKLKEILEKNTDTKPQDVIQVDEEIKGKNVLI
jgi:tetratricopeptide (TPR) repeat protein